MFGRVPPPRVKCVQLAATSVCALIVAHTFTAGGATTNGGEAWQAVGSSDGAATPWQFVPQVSGVVGTAACVSGRPESGGVLLAGTRSHPLEDAPTASPVARYCCHLLSCRWSERMSHRGSHRGLQRGSSQSSSKELRAPAEVSDMRTSDEGAAADPLTA